MAKNSIAKVSVRDFGPFQDLEITPSPGLNVVVGDNATGKSQLLKLMYSATRELKVAEVPSKEALKRELARKLLAVFRPDAKKIGRLTRRVRGRSRAEVEIKYSGIAQKLAFSFSSAAEKWIDVASVPPVPIKENAVFLPAHELLSLSSAFLALYEIYDDLPFDETWYDTFSFLMIPPTRGARAKTVETTSQALASVLTGVRVDHKEGYFFLYQPKIGNIEAALLAEGHRKLAMLLRLVSNGVLASGGYLFWDEPEANLNPAAQHAVVSALRELADNGTQVFVATHSMYIIRELEMSETPCRFFSLSRSTADDEGAQIANIVVQQADDFVSLDNVASLDAEVSQAERYLAW